MTQESTPPSIDPPLLSRRAVSSLALAAGVSGLVLAGCGGDDAATSATGASGQATGGTPTNTNTPSPTATASSAAPSTSPSTSPADQPPMQQQPPPQQQPPQQQPPQQQPPQQQPSTAPRPAGTRLASASDVPSGGGVVLGSQKIVLTNTGGTIRGFSAACTHQGCTVGGVSGGTINCPCHGSRFDAASGAVVNGPASRALATVRVVVQDGVVYKP